METTETTQTSDAPDADTAAAEVATTDARPVFLLAADGPLRPAVTLGQGWPGRVSGLPAFYYWKDAIRTGTYAHPSGRYALSVTRQKLDGYAATFAAMRANGVGVPILMDHAPTAAATLGWIVAVRREGDALLELHQFLGEGARDTGLRNHVSLGIDPDFIDGRGVRYGEAIVHSAVTPVPVVPGQDEFRPASDQELAGGGRAVVALSRVEGDGEGELRTSNIERPTSNEAGRDGPAAPPAIVGSSTLDVGRSMFATEPSLLADAATARRDLAVFRGGIDPATADALLALLTGGPEPTIGLSRTAGGRPLAVAVFDALANNRPVLLGELTGPQSGGRLHLLARAVPGGEATADLTGRMIALANGTAGPG
jgi:hypothetical protein